MQKKAYIHPSMEIRIVEVESLLVAPSKWEISGEGGTGNSILIENNDGENPENIDEVTG